MTNWIVVPVKPLDEGKTRLAKVLTDEARQRLNGDMFARTLRVVSAACGLDRLLIVSRSSEALRVANEMGARALQERPFGDLNAALTQAALSLASSGATGILSLSADLPLLQPSDVHLMLGNDRSDRRIVIAPDRDRTGTNALMIVPPRAIAYRYGPGSFAAHTDLARSKNLATSIVETPTLAFDIDTADDLETARQLGAITEDTLVQADLI